MKRLEAIADMAWVLSPGLSKDQIRHTVWVTMEKDGRWTCKVAYGATGHMPFIDHTAATPDEAVQNVYDQLVLLHRRVQQRSQSNIERWASRILRLITGNKPS